MDSRYPPHFGPRAQPALSASTELGKIKPITEMGATLPVKRRGELCFRGMAQQLPGGQHGSNPAIRAKRPGYRGPVSIGGLQAVPVTSQKER